jgi:16S rRNA processing protein RimM
LQSPEPSLSAKPSPDFVQVGVVVGAHSFDGRLRIQRDTDNPARFRRGSELWIGAEPHRVQSTGGTADQVLVKLSGIDTREAAAALLREPVLVPAHTLPSLPDDTYYHYQLIDMTVRDDAGEVLGTLTEIISTGANDVYVITAPDRELLLPAIGDVVQSVDVPAAAMTVRLPEGLEWRPLKPAGEQKRKPPRRRPRARKPPPQTPPQA